MRANEILGIRSQKKGGEREHDGKRRQETESKMEERRHKHCEKDGNNEWMKRCRLIKVKRYDWGESFCNFSGSAYQMPLYLSRSLHLFFLSFSPHPPITSIQYEHFYISLLLFFLYKTDVSLSNNSDSLFKPSNISLENLLHSDTAEKTFDSHTC